MLDGLRQVGGKSVQDLRDRAAELLASVAAGEPIDNELVRELLTAWIEQSGMMEMLDAALNGGPLALGIAIRVAHEALGDRGDGGAGQVG